MKAGSKKSYLLTRSNDILHKKVGGGWGGGGGVGGGRGLSTGIISHIYRPYKWTFEDHLLNIVQKVLSKRLTKKYKPWHKYQSTCLLLAN